MPASDSPISGDLHLSPTLLLHPPARTYVWAISLRQQNLMMDQCHVHALIQRASWAFKEGMRAWIVLTDNFIVR